MKKTFSWFMALFTSVLLLVTGCSNASQITFGDSSKSNFTEDGLAAVTINADFNTGARSIWPEDWADGDKRALLYELTGDTGGTLSSTVFRYDEIMKNKAVVNLAPVSNWKLTLKAYQVTPDNYKTRTIAGGHVVLQAVNSAVDLTKGNQAVTFNLDSIGLNDADAKGRVDIKVNFYKENKIVKAKFEVLNGNSSPVNVATAKSGSTASVASGDDMVAASGTDIITAGNTDNISDGTKFATITDIGNPDDGYASIILQGELPVGQHTLRVILYTKSAKPDYDGNKKSDFIPGLVYQEPIYIEGGNVSGKVINIGKGSINKAPAAPANLKSYVSFDDAKAVTVCENGAKAQIIGADSIGAGTIADTYNLKFDWTDVPDNESKFKLVLSKSDANDNDGVEIKYDSSNDGIIATGLGAYSSGHEAELGKIKKKAGSLVAGSETVTLIMPTTFDFMSAKIYAENKMTDDGEALAEACQLKKAIGMKTVAYGLTAAAPAEVAVVNYASAGSTKNNTDKFFVMAYEVGTPASEFMNTSSYPYVSLASGKYALTGWAKSIDYDFAKGTGSDDSVNVALGSTDPLTDNILVFPRWSVNTTVGITFPGYDDVRDLGVLTSPSDNPVVKVYDKTPDADNTITITAFKAAGNNTDTQPYTSGYKFTIIDPNGVKVFETLKDLSGVEATVSSPDASVPKFTGIAQSAIGASGDSSNILTWDINDAGFIGGVYQVIISYDYDHDGNGTIGAKNIGGTIYVRIDR